MQWTLLKDPSEVASTACDRIVQASKLVIAERGEFHLVLAGGSTPARTYEMLAASQCDWEHWHIWFGDERCLPPDHPERNSVMAERTLFCKVNIPPSQIYTIPAESGPDVAAKQYADLIEGVPPFDMVLLGMGSDGHTASLFPGQQYPAGQAVLPVYNAPKPPAQRVSLSAGILSQCRQLLFIITGKDKLAAVSRWRQGECLPVSMVHGIDKTEIIIDCMAFPQNNSS